MASFTRSSNSVSRWQRGLLALCAFGFALWSFNIFQINAWHGWLGLHHTATEVPFHDVVTAVVPDGPAAKAGLERSDVVDLRAASAADRWRFRFGLLADSQYTYTFVRGITEQSKTLRSTRLPIDLSASSWYFGALGALIFAAIIAWRRPQVVEARLLCLLLAASVIDVCFLPNNWRTPWAALDFGTTIVEAGTSEAVVVLLIVYTLLFGRPISILRKAIAAFSFLILSLDFAIGLVVYGATWSGAFDPLNAPFEKTALLQFWEPLVVLACPLLVIATAIAAARGRERSLLVWTTALLFVNYLMTAVSGFIPASVLPRYIGNASELLTPFAIGYAVLNRRLLDIGFVINQAAVFSGVSIIVVGLFMLGEWLLGGWFSRAGHVTNLVISAVLALGLGFSVRAIHARVDRVLDRVFFRKRHDRETAIRSFAEEASEAADAATLVRRTKETLETHAGAAFVTVLVGDGTGNYGDASESDPAIVALRDRHKALDLHTVSSQLQGEFAYPMIARGQLIGALVVGPKRSGETYAPDESGAIMHLAHEIASALHILTLEKTLEERGVGSV